jgi:phosphoglycolate phosphatase-like HAD superfamily hydrolase
MSTTDHQRLALLFDIDGTLIITGGAGAASWINSSADGPPEEVLL